MTRITDVCGYLTWLLSCAVVQVTTCREWEHIVSAPPQAPQFAYLSLNAAAHIQVGLRS